jgi:TfoX/Sxy family transcriptional regulator of competence genes
MENGMTPVKKSTDSKRAGTMKRRKMPAWKKSPPHLVALFNAAITAFPEATTRMMFGYPCAFVNGQLTTGLFAESMFVRLSPEDEAKLLRTAGAQPFEPIPGRRVRGYVASPDKLLGSERNLKKWIGSAIEFSQSLPMKTKK